MGNHTPCSVMAPELWCSLTVTSHLTQRRNKKPLRRFLKVIDAMEPKFLLIEARASTTFGIGVPRSCSIWLMYVSHRRFQRAG